MRNPAASRHNPRRSEFQRLGEQFRVIAGVQQSGADGANSAAKFFFDFYVSRPLPKLNFGSTASDSEPLLRWFGNVRIGSTPVATLSLSALRTSLKGLKINELAQSAEFLTGLDVTLGYICPAVGAERQFAPALSSVVHHGLRRDRQLECTGSRAADHFAIAGSAPQESNRATISGH